MNIYEFVIYSNRGDFSYCSNLHLACSLLVSSVKLINSRNALISCSACNSIGEIGRNGPLPLPAGVETMDQGVVVLEINLTFPK